MCLDQEPVQAAATLPRERCSPFAMVLYHGEVARRDELAVEALAIPVDGVDVAELAPEDDTLACCELGVDILRGLARVVGCGAGKWPGEGGEFGG